MKNILTIMVLIVLAIPARAAIYSNRFTTNTDANATAAAQAVVPLSASHSTNSDQLGGNLPSYYAAASNVVATTEDTNGIYTVGGTNAPFAFPGGVGASIPITALFVTSGRSAYQNTWFTNANTSPPSWISTVNAVRYITNALYNGVVTVAYGGFTLGGGAGGAFAPGAATNSTLLGNYTPSGDTTATNTFVYTYPMMYAGSYLPNNTNAPPPVAAIPNGGCFIQCSNDEIYYFFNTNNGTLVTLHYP